MNNESEKKIKFSVIIPVQAINDYVLETCGKLAEIEDKNFEIIIFPDELPENSAQMEEKLGARIIASGKVSPAIKRDMALEHAQGDFLAFTDDDAYPDPDWFVVAENKLVPEEVAAIGGPQLTPPNDSFWQKVSGAVFLSPLSGGVSDRYWPGKKVCEVEDWPTVNFIIKKKDFAAIGGFDSQYWPGEDTKLCLDIIKKLQKKILYIPELIVHHHRRAGLKKHLKQIGNYGLHRGFFAKAFPETSRRPVYFVPSLFDVYLFGGLVISLILPKMIEWYVFGIAIYVLVILISTIFVWSKTKDFMVSLATIPYVIATHIWYGIRFIQGFIFTKKLNSKLGK